MWGLYTSYHAVQGKEMQKCYTVDVCVAKAGIRIMAQIVNGHIIYGAYEVCSRIHSKS